MNATKANAPAGDRGAGRTRFQGANCGSDGTTNRTRLALLDRLDGLRSTGPDTWRARCPAHGSRGLSLSVKDCGDRLLLKCFAGCGAADVVHSVGLELADLFDQPEHREPLPHRDRLRVNPRDVIVAIRFDLIRLAMLLSNLATTGARITPETHAAIALIIGNLMAGMEVAR